MSNAREISQSPSEELSNDFFAGLVDQLRAFLEANDMNKKDRKMEFEVSGERYVLELKKVKTDNP